MAALPSSVKPFPTAAYALVLILILLLCALLGLHVFNLHRTLRLHEPDVVHLGSAAVGIASYGKASSMLTQIGTAPGDVQREVSRKGLGGELKDILVTTVGKPQKTPLTTSPHKASTTDDHFPSAEHKPWALVRLDDRNNAFQLLPSRGYRTSKLLISLGLLPPGNTASAAHGEPVTVVSTGAGALLATIAATITLLAVLTVILLRTIRGSIAARESAQNELLLAKEVLKQRVSEATAELRDSSAHLAAIFNNIKCGVVVFEPLEDGSDFIIRNINPASLAIERLRQDEVLGRTLTEVFPGSDEFGLLETLRRVQATGEATVSPAKFHSEEGFQGWREYFVSQLPTGEVMTIYYDITERKHAEQVLRQSEQSFRKVFNSVYDAIFLHDLNGRILDVNEAMLHMFDVTREQALAGSVENDFSSASNPLGSLAEKWDRARSGERLFFDWIARRPGDGSEFDVEVFLRRVDFGGNECLMVNVRDVSARRKTQRLLAQSERRFRDVALTSGDWIWEVNAQGRYTFASGRVKELLGYEPQDLYSMTPFDLMPPEEVGSIQGIFAELVANKAPIVDLENSFVAKDGTRGVFLTNGVPLFDDQGNVAGYFGVDKDITQRKADEQKLKLFEAVFKNALEGISITDAQGDIVAVNPAFTDITGYAPEEVLGQNPRVLKSDRHEAKFYEDMWQELLTHGNWVGEVWNRRKSGEAYPEWLSISAIRDEQKNTTHFVAVFHDITEMKRKEKQIAFQAFHDPLTGLPNRVLLLDRLNQSIAHALRNGARLGVLFIDLDNFKHVNDSLGHSTGDKLLKKAAERFASMLREEDTVARLGGDEFVIMLPELEEPENAVQLAERIISAFASPFSIEGKELFVTPSVGITIFPDDGSTPEDLIKNADMAMYRAKDGGKNALRMFTEEMNTLVTRRLTLENQLRRALTRDEFTVYFQPKVNLVTGMITGMEALARWIRFDGEVTNPDEFIPLAEETGIIVALGEKVILEACAKTRDLIQAGHVGLKVSVNLSPRQFRQQDLILMIKEALDFTGLDASCLELEITETTLARDIDNAVEILGQLAALGIGLAIDDFGTGYSSLYYLKRLPIDILKIDRSFVRDLPDDADDAILVSTILLMARNLNLRVVAEGAEKKEQVDFLKHLECDEIQGFFYGKPMPYQAFLEHLESWPIQSV